MQGLNSGAAPLRVENINSRDKMERQAYLVAQANV